MRYDERKTPPGQRSEVTSPSLAVAGAVVAVLIGVLAFSFWPNTGTVRTNAVSNAPHSEQSVPAQTPPTRSQ
jgi:hypothetical protein